jgi:uncharacterized protein (DUF924 family)/GNAT superfamily N-acetyltransferase
MPPAGRLVTSSAFSTTHPQREREMHDLEIVFDPLPPESLTRFVTDGLASHNIAATGFSNWYPVGFFLKSARGEWLGGLLGNIWGGWLHVTHLWLASPARGRGHGSRLLQAAEGYAIERGCIAATLETQSFEARPFYEKRGYRVFATLEDCPPGHSKFFLRKELAAGSAQTLPHRAKALLDFWFAPPDDPERERHRAIWFKSTEEFDAVVRREFLADYEAAAAGALREWEASAEGALAVVLLLDQVPRNIFRGTPRAYATDAAARAATERALERGFDQLVPPVWRSFFYMPLHHSEDIADQRRSLGLFEALPPDTDRPDPLRYARRYNEIIARFGRFPHRNEILGRQSTEAELAFLAQPDPLRPSSPVIHSETGSRSG